MSISINVFDLKTDQTLFSYEAPVAPCENEVIQFDFSAHDQPEWSAEAWAHYSQIKNTAWLVVRVRHAVRVNSLRSTRHRVIVDVKAVTL